MDASSQSGLRVSQSPELAREIRLKFVEVCGSAIRQRILQLLPDSFIGIKFRRVGREVLKMKTRDFTSEGADHRSMVSDAVVQ